MFCKNTIHRNLSNIAYNTLHSLRPKGTFVLTFITNRGLFCLNDLSILKRRNMDMSTKVYAFVTASCHKIHIFVLPKYFSSVLHNSDFLFLMPRCRSLELNIWSIITNPFIIIYVILRLFLVFFQYVILCMILSVVTFNSSYLFNLPYIMDLVLVPSGW